MTLRRLIALVAVFVAAAALVVAPPAAAAPAAGAGPLTNLAHLDFLGDRVTPPEQAGHTTYRLSTEPAVGVLWTYADRNADGTYRRVGGGTFHPETNTWGQGAFNADDLSRAAVVYLRHWRATGSESSRASAYGLLRGLTYLQTAVGPNAGTVVLWQQPDGALNPSADPKESPDPSDSDASYWLARTTWALGEGYAAFVRTDPDFAGFLRERLDLAVRALDRQVLDAYGQFLLIDGRRTPAWLIRDGADATAEAVLGLSAYVGALGAEVPAAAPTAAADAAASDAARGAASDAARGAAAARTTAARRALARLAGGVAMMAAGDARTWPFGAVLPWGLSRSDWHAWGSQMPAALARAAVALGDPRLARVAATDSAVFDPWLLTSGGPDNGRLPTAVDRTQIAYGIDSRVQSLVATADATHQAGALRMAGITAAWYFGANAAGVPVYDPATGRTVDGVESSGKVNLNAGAESTIHGLLSMLALDAHPEVAAIARTATVVERVGTTTLQAEDATLAGAAAAVVPGSLWTGESSYGGSGYAALGAGGSATFALPPGPAALVLPVVDLRPGSSAVTSFSSSLAGATASLRLGAVRSGAIGPQGDSPAFGALLPVTLPRPLAPGSTSLVATTQAAGADRAVLDAVLIEPLLSRYVLSGDGHGTAVVRSADVRTQGETVNLPGTGRARVEVYNGHGNLVSVTSTRAAIVPVTVLPGGFTIARR